MKTGLAFFGAVLLCWMWRRHVWGTLRFPWTPLSLELFEVFVLVFALVGYFSALGYP